MSAEALRLLDEAVRDLKLTTVGYSRVVSYSPEKFATTRWGTALDKLRQLRGLVDEEAPPSPPPVPPGGGTLTQTIRDGDRIEGPVRWEAIPSVPASKVEFLVDAVSRHVENAAPYEWKGTGMIAPADLGAGEHLLVTRAALTYGGTAEARAKVTVSAPVPGPTPVPTPGPGPSGEAMPVGDLPGWRQVFIDDFTNDVPLGQFPAAVADGWNAYPYPWKDSPGNEGVHRGGRYHPGKVVSIHDGVLDCHFRTEGGEHLIAAFGPKNMQLYGRYAIRFKADPIPRYKGAWLMWPKSEEWPRDGEIDFPEGDFDREIEAYMHRQNGTSGGDQDGYRTGVKFSSGWHTAVTEWLPDRCTFILDGKVIGNSTQRIPNTPMRWNIQNETSFTGEPADSTQGHLYLDWVAVWARA